MSFSVRTTDVEFEVAFATDLMSSVRLDNHERL